jgi:hypothetical protein
VDLFDILALSKRLWPTMTSLIIAAALVFFPHAVTSMVWREAQSRAVEFPALFERALDRGLGHGAHPHPCVPAERCRR